MGGVKQIKGIKKYELLVVKFSHRDEKYSIGNTVSNTEVTFGDRHRRVMHRVKESLCWTSEVDIAF